MTLTPSEQRLAALFCIVSDRRGRRKSIRSFDHELWRLGSKTTGEQIAGWYDYLKNLPPSACPAYHQAIVDYSMPIKTSGSFSEALIGKVLREEIRSD